MPRDVGVIRRDKVFGGDGYFFLGQVNTYYSEIDFRTRLGATSGSFIITAQNPKKVFRTGAPLKRVKAIYTGRGLKFKATLHELDIRALAIKMGGTRATTVAGTTVVTNEKITLIGTEWFHLNGRALTVFTSMTDGGGTPAPWSGTTDYERDLVEGLIRRRSGSLIPDGAVVYNNYSYARPAYEKITIGTSVAVAYYPLRIVIPVDGSTLRWIVDVYRACPSDDEFNLEFPPEDFFKYDFEMEAESAPGRAVDDDLYSMILEDASLVV